MLTFRLLLAAFAFGGAAAAQAPPAVDAAIVIAVDVSGSVDANEFAIQRDGYIAALRNPGLVAAIRAGRFGRVALAYFEWSGKVFPDSVAPWIIVAGPEDAEVLAAAIAALPSHSVPGTAIGRALDVASALHDARPGAPARRIIDVSGDGPNNRGPEVAAARDRAVERDATINGLPLLVRPSPSTPDLARYFEDCVIGGSDAFIVPAFGMADLAAAIRRKLVLEISGASPPARQQWRVSAPADCETGGEPYYPGLYE